jgi:hypothetical protein
MVQALGNGFESGQGDCDEAVIELIIDTDTSGEVPGVDRHVEDAVVENVAPRHRTHGVVIDHFDRRRSSERGCQIRCSFSIPHEGIQAQRVYWKLGFYIRPGDAVEQQRVCDVRAQDMVDELPDCPFLAGRPFRPLFRLYRKQPLTKRGYRSIKR